MSDEIKNRLFELTKQGLLIDLSNIYKGESFICSNFYVIGHYMDMDEMYNNLEKNKSRASMKGTRELFVSETNYLFYSKSLTHK